MGGRLTERGLAPAPFFIAALSPRPDESWLARRTAGESSNWFEALESMGGVRQGGFRSALFLFLGFVLRTSPPLLGGPGLSHKHSQRKKVSRRWGCRRLGRGDGGLYLEVRHQGPNQLSVTVQVWRQGLSGSIGIPVHLCQYQQRPPSGTSVLSVRLTKENKESYRHVSWPLAGSL